MTCVVHAIPKPNRIVPTPHGGLLGTKKPAGDGLIIAAAGLLPILRTKIR